MQAFVNVAGKPRAELKGYLSAPWGEADVAILDRDVGAVAQKSRPGITPCGLICNCWSPSSVAAMTTGERHKGSALTWNFRRRDGAARSALSPTKTRDRCRMELSAAPRVTDALPIGDRAEQKKFI